MDKFELSDRFRLELHWGDAIYEQEGVCKLTDAYFSGPALQEAVRLQDEDHILLDFFNQYFVLVEKVYVATFSWKGPDYRSDGRVYFSEATVSHDTELNRVPQLNKGDYLIIDTEGHQVEQHPFNLVYTTYVVNEDTQLYKFGGN